MARPVHLQFISRPSRRWPWLLLALAALAISWTYHQDTRQRMDAARLKALARQALPRPQVSPPDPGVNSLNLPWQHLLHALEKTPQRDIALLALEAEGRSGVLRLQAETPDAKHLQAYLQMLAEQGLYTPRLTQQQNHSEDGGPTVTRFNLEARWQH
jgi:ABC-type uncharacterized transport system involved in gliding motility auxiliary subunit